MTERLRAPVVSFALFLAIAAIAYGATLLFVYPRFFAPFSAFHSDMYMPVDFATRGVTFGELLHWPRPVYWIALLAGGHLGFKGSLVFFTALLLVALALSMLVVERFAVRAPIPWWVAFAAFVLAFAGPAMYFEPGLDVGYTLALLFGMLGMYAWEARGAKPWHALALAGIAFTLSALSKESFLPALVVYGIACGIRDRSTPGSAIAIVLLPFVAAAVGFADGRFMHSPFVNPSARSTDPYYISFAPASMQALWTYYTAPLRTWFVALFLVACFAAMWAQRRLWIGVTILIAAIAMYLPYLVLPNHRIYFYECVPVPVLALLVPLALVGSEVAIGAVTVGALFVAVRFLSLQNLADPEQNWGLTQQSINRNAYKAVFAVQPQIAAARSVLVTGLAYPYHPWIYPAFLGPLLHFNGDWTVETEPPYAPIALQPHARPIDRRDVHLKDYDLVLGFNGKGQLVKAYDPQTTAAPPQTALPSPTPVQAFPYPGGLVPPADETSAVQRGVYPAAGGETCCFLAKTATIVLAKAPGDTTAIFTFFVPDFSPFANSPERIAMTFNGIAMRPIDVPKGLHDVAVRLPRALASKGTLNAFLDMTIAYVPAEIGINSDTRTLSIVLTQVRYR